MKFIACVDDNNDDDNNDDKENIELAFTKERMKKKKNMKLIKLRSFQRAINCTNTQVIKHKHTIFSFGAS